MRSSGGAAQRLLALIHGQKHPLQQQQHDDGTRPEQKRKRLTGVPERVGESVFTGLEGNNTLINELHEGFVPERKKRRKKINSLSFESAKSKDIKLKGKHTAAKPVNAAEAAAYGNSKEDKSHHERATVGEQTRTHCRQLLDTRVNCEAFTQKRDDAMLTPEITYFRRTWSPKTEQLRMKYASKLRSLLLRLCRTHKRNPPLLAFERWQCRCKLQEQQERTAQLRVRKERTNDKHSKVAEGNVGERWEPLLPTKTTADEGLVQDLERAKFTESKESEIEEQLSAASARLASKLVDYEESLNVASKLESDSSVKHFDDVRVDFRGKGKTSTVTVALGDSKPYLQISLQHYDKLEKLHSTWWKKGYARQTEGEDVSEQSHFRCCLWNLLARYEGLKGHGYQAALPGEVFDVLFQELQVSGECFASPLNARYCHFCSAFPDVDCFFGAHGSFFSFTPTSGSYEANPPFVPELMLDAIEHMEDLLQKATGPLSFSVIIPNWKHVTAWKRLQKSKWRRHGVVIAKDRHRYV